MFCHNCGTKLEEGSAFCPECGARQLETEGPADFTSNISESDFESSEVDNVDYEAEDFEDKYPDIPDEDRKPSGSGKGLIIGVILIVVLGIAFGVGGFFIYQKAFSDKTEIVHEETEGKEQAEASEKKDEGSVTADEKEGEKKTENKDDTAKQEEEKEPEEKTYIHEYTIIPEMRTWTDAKAYCEVQGGHLATVVSQEEYDQIVAKANETGCAVLWLGAQRAGNSEFQWITGEAFTYGAWAAGEPNNDGGIENYLGMMKVQGTWLMYDMPDDVSQYYSSDKVGFVMEKDIEQ